MTVALWAAFWLGILTAISPCPMATNVAAISFIGKSLSRPSQVLLSGLLYALGRVLAYVGLAAALVGGVLAAPAVSQFLQKNLNKALGPLLILAGMFLLEMLSLNFGRGGRLQGLQERVAKGGYLGSLALGVLFACAFCPVSAGLFFLSLLPLSVKHHSAIVLPAFYGIGTGLPVVLFAFLVAFGARSVGAAFSKLSAVEKWARSITGVILIAVGVYWSLIYVYGIQLPR